MNAFKRKSLYTAVVAGLATVGASMNAGAVNLSTDGTGAVLLYPYYTVRNGLTTSFSVVNTSTSLTKVVKVRFLEGKNSAEVLDFNLWLSPRDVWTGAIVDNGSGAAVYSPDNSCTAPALGKTPATAQPFVNYYYTGQVSGTVYDNAGAGLDRTREGYIELIEMGEPSDVAGAAAHGVATTPVGISLAAAVKHQATGIPFNCPYVQVNTLFVNGTEILSPLGGLAGNYIIINGATGTEMAHTPVPLQNFYVPLISNALYTIPGTLGPQLINVSPASSIAFIPSVGGVALATVPDWSAAPPAGPGGRAIDAVSAILMRSAIMNEYDVSPNFKTDIVITQPTKRFYVATSLLASDYTTDPVAAIGPYRQTFANATADAARSCDLVFPAAYDREEAPYTSAGIAFSPIPVGASGLGQLCWEATVMTVVPGTGGATAAGSAVFASANAASLTLPSSGSSMNYASGWVGLWPTTTSGTTNSPGQSVSGGGISPVVVTNNAFGGLSAGTSILATGLSGAASTPPNVRYRGLPVIGFAATTAAIGGQGYGGIFDNKYNVSINTP